MVPCDQAKGARGAEPAGRCVKTTALTRDGTSASACDEAPAASVGTAGTRNRAAQRRTVYRLFTDEGVVAVA